MATKTVGDLYLRLIEQFPLKPLRTDADHERAIAVIDSLIDREDLAVDEEEYLEVLSRLVEDFEAETDPVGDLTGVEALRYLIRENGLTQRQLSAETGIPVATLSEILNRKRGITPKVREALAKRFRVRPDLFI